MKYYLLFILLSVIQLSSAGQSTHATLSGINTIPQAEKLIQADSTAELITIHPGQDLAEIPPTIFDRKLGYTFVSGSCIYKIISIERKIMFRVSYIYLDGAAYSKTKIDQTRQEIISKYKNGVSFADLAKQYNMDPNPTGDTNWFEEGAMIPAFEKEVKLHKKGDIFTVDEPTQNWYHVVLKTYSDRYVKNLHILKVRAHR